ncbi:flagellar basal body P-ring formation chaperone FlgA [Thioclava atlantica]|uniref:Flagella basal body P-ring formation protein FlgA n=1 Tax=Thioclava atlantica TaxID=1317124 RepID=A0A085TVK0_9RHOB|nr:flagellar basal body P-ring formation chaperone FlgA [Thioclava atlantica]KFE34747.1 flagellar basal body P-ring biosynthesis protein FlgA [Thioclava atlantica]
MRWLFALALIAAPGLAPADILVAKRTLRAQTVIAPGDVALAEGEGPGIATHLEEAIGFETRAVIYAGRPIRRDALGAPALVERNQSIALVYRRGGLEIRTEGRALQRAGAGEVIRVMNSASRAIVSARLAADGTAQVTQ